MRLRRREIFPAQTPSLPCGLVIRIISLQFTPIFDIFEISART